VIAAPPVPAASARAPVTTISRPYKAAFDPHVAVDAHGDAIAVWIRRGDHDDDIVQAGIRPARSRVWRAPRDLSAPGAHVCHPQVAVNRHGDAIVAWVRSNGRHDSVQVAVRPAASRTWRAADDLVPTGRDANAPQVAIDARGDATVVWQRSDANGLHYIQSATRRAASGTWQQPQNLSTPGPNALGPRLAIDERGDAIAVWRYAVGATHVIQAAVRAPSGGAWLPAQRVSPAGDDAYTPQVALDARGDATVVWRNRPYASRPVVRATTRAAASGRWHAARTLSALGGAASAPQVAVNRRGDAVTVWQRRFRRSGITIIEAATRKGAIGRWAPPRRLSGSEGASMAPQVAIDARGTAAAVWTADVNRDTELFVQAATRPAGSPTWRVRRNLSDTRVQADAPQVAFGPRGPAIAVWERFLGRSLGVQAAVLPGPER
jgi:hypothetical protein